MRARVIAAASAAAIVVMVAFTPYPGRLLRRVEQATARDTTPPFRESKTLVPGEFNGRTFADRGTVFRYQLFIPRGYDSSKRWPVVVAVHGSAEKGSDGVKQLGVGVAKLVRAQAATAAKLAEILCGHPMISAVLYPGLSCHGGHAIAARQMAGRRALLVMSSGR